MVECESNEIAEGLLNSQQSQLNEQKELFYAPTLFHCLQTRGRILCQVESQKRMTRFPLH